MNRLAEAVKTVRDWIGGAVERHLEGLGQSKCQEAYQLMLAVYTHMATMITSIEHYGRCDFVPDDWHQNIRYVIQAGEALGLEQPDYWPLVHTLSGAASLLGAGRYQDALSVLEGSKTHYNTLVAHYQARCA